MTSPTATPRPSSRPKTVLHCFECGHQSRIDGDWTVQRTGDCIAYDCPDCETTITTRPRSSNGRDRERESAPSAGLCRCLGD